MFYLAPAQLGKAMQVEMDLQFLLHMVVAVVVELAQWAVQRRQQKAAMAALDYCHLSVARPHTTAAVVAAAHSVTPLLVVLVAQAVAVMVGLDIQVAQVLVLVLIQAVVAEVLVLNPRALVMEVQVL
jgi:hypothetical protein